MQAAHGVTVMQLQRDRNGWTRDRGSRFTRRITANTPMEITGPGARPSADAHPRGPRRHARARHLRELRGGQDAVGHVPHLRRKRRRLLRRRAHAARDQQGLRADRRQPPLADARRTVSTAGTSRIRASTWRTSRTSPSASAGWWRSIRTIRIRAAQAHGARALSARGREHHRRQDRPCRRLHGRRRQVRVHLQVRDTRSLRREEPRRESRPARPRHVVCRAFQCRTATASGCRWYTTKRAR